LVVSVYEIKAQYQVQNFVRGRVGAIDAIGAFFKKLFTGSDPEPREDAFAHKAYKYYALTKTRMTYAGESPMQTFSDGHVGNALSFNANEALSGDFYFDICDDLPSEKSSEDLCALMASFYQMSSSRTDNYFSTSVRSGSLGMDEFYGQNGGVQSMIIDVGVYTGGLTRLTVRLFAENPESYKTKHDRVTEWISIVGTILGTIGVIFLAVSNPAGWIATAISITTAVALSVGTAATIERVSSDVSATLNKDYMKGAILERRAYMYEKMFTIKDEKIHLSRIPESDINADIEAMMPD